MGLEHSVGDESGRNTSSPEKATVKTLNGFLCRFDGIKFDVYLALGNDCISISLKVEYDCKPESLSRP